MRHLISYGLLALALAAGNMACSTTSNRKAQSSKVKQAKRQGKPKSYSLGNTVNEDYLRRGQAEWYANALDSY